MEVALSIFFGGLITILTAICVENLRRPRLSLAIEDSPLDVPSPDGKGMRRNLRLILRNHPLPRVARWMQRAAATQCRGEITFHHLDGQDIFGRTMAVRWVGSPEPIPSRIVGLNGTVQFFIQDFSRTTTDSRIDVYPGEGELLDVAVRFNDEADCYGWNNDSYFCDWRNPNWILYSERYLVKVVINSSGEKCTDAFRLVNDVKRTDFRLILASAEDKAKVL
jgi:hypothetical protein